VDPKVLKRCPGLLALSLAASVPAWPALPFGEDKISAFKDALRWKTQQIVDKDLQMPSDSETQKMVAFLNGVQ